MTHLFNLVVPEGRTRSGIDAYLHFKGLELPFELKSTTGSSVSTVRDFGPDHVAKWRDGLHWLFAFYNPKSLRLEYCVYASPLDMEPWIAEKERYVAPDLALADLVPELITEQTTIDALGFKKVYSTEDARLLMKKQWSANRYISAMDLNDGYSLSRMTELLRARSRYLVLRGSTLNNPHIERAYFSSFEKITADHASRLRALVTDYLNAAETDSATA